MFLVTNENMGLCLFILGDSIKMGTFDKFEATLRLSSLLVNKNGHHTLAYVKGCECKISEEKIKNGLSNWGEVLS